MCGRWTEIVPEKGVRLLSLPEGVTARIALVYDRHLAQSVEAEGYFDSIVEARTLFA